MNMSKCIKQTWSFLHVKYVSIKLSKHNNKDYLLCTPFTPPHKKKNLLLDRPPEFGSFIPIVVLTLYIGILITISIFS